MNKMRSVIVAILGGAFLLVSTSCSQPIGSTTDTPTEKKDSITIERCFISTYPQDWYTSHVGTWPYLCLNIEFSISDSLTEENIDQIKIHVADTQWAVSFEKNYDQNLKIFYNSSMYDSSNLNELEIGNAAVKISKKDGTIVTKNFIIGTPGSSVSNGKNWVYHPDLISTVDPAISETALSIATITGQTKNEDEVEIHFTTDDTRVENGYIIFYDTTGETEVFIGGTTYFYTNFAATMNPDFNNGLAVSYTDTNSFKIKKEDIHYGNRTNPIDTEFSKITSYRVFLIDKLLTYDNTENFWYRYNSVSLLSDF